MQGMSMNQWLDDEQREVAAKLLVNKYEVSIQLLGELLGKNIKDQANQILQKQRSKKLTHLDLAELLILHKGPSLFSGSQEVVRKLRRHLLAKLAKDELEELFQRNRTKKDNICEVSRMLKPLATKNWHADGRWAHDFVETLGFPRIFAGVRSNTKKPVWEDFSPFQPAPDLTDFQEKLKQEMLKILRQEEDKTRCMITLPTGAGKTRVAVEALIEWLKERFSEGKYLIWVAQSEELCEQAIACIQQMWQSKEYVRPLRIYRYFGGSHLRIEHMKGGVVVASINQLYSRADDCNNSVMRLLLKKCGAMVIDEAHRAVTKMYKRVFTEAKKHNPSLFPICGLTATPGRTDYGNGGETKKLVGYFECNLITPNLGKEYDKNPLRYFKKKGYLAKATHIIHSSGQDYELTEEEIDQMDREGDLPSLFRRRLANDNKRNQVIISRLLEIPKDEPALIYACTVEHAHFISLLLSRLGRTSAAISGDTSLPIRRGIIRDFKDEKIQFLCNYGVLTTGFDAPKTKYIILCRPTVSEVLYEQIVGRGLRGPKFGGTEMCSVIDFADNIERLGRSFSYARFKDFWDEEKDE